MVCQMVKHYNFTIYTSSMHLFFWKYELSGDKQSPLIANSMSIWIVFDFDQTMISNHYSTDTTKQSGNICLLLLESIFRGSSVFHQNTFASINSENSKLRSYALFKTDIGFENYLNSVHNTHSRKSFTKFRLSNHTLMIERGRHQKINKNLRYCPFCPNEIEDETHFLIDCKCFGKHRTIFLRDICSILNHPLPREKTDIFIMLMSHEQIIARTAQYICDTSEVREFLLNRHKNNI